MDRDRTNTTHEEPADPRIACSDSRSDSRSSRAMKTGRHDATSSIGAPRRVGESDHQGARAGETRKDGSRKATAVARLKGGASPSKWTRRTRPWNASTPTAVVDSFHAGPRSALEVYSGGEVPEAGAGESIGGTRQHAVRKGSRIHGSPVRSRAGRGRPERSTGPERGRPAGTKNAACGPFLFPRSARA